MWSFKIKRSSKYILTLILLEFILQNAKRWIPRYKGTDRCCRALVLPHPPLTADRIAKGAKPQFISTGRGTGRRYTLGVELLEDVSSYASWGDPSVRTSCRRFDSQRGGAPCESSCASSTPRFWWSSSRTLPRRIWRAVRLDSKNHLLFFDTLSH